MGGNVAALRPPVPPTPPSPGPVPPVGHGSVHSGAVDVSGAVRRCLAVLCSGVAHSDGPLEVRLFPSGLVDFSVNRHKRHVNRCENILE